MLAKVTDLKDEPIIGQSYLVPCVQFNTAYYFVNSDELVQVPVFGPPHDDADYLKFPLRHYHFDVRFISPKMRIASLHKHLAIERMMVHVLPVYEIVGPVQWQPLKCIRRMPDFPCPPVAAESSTHNFRCLENAYADKTLCRKSMICPHRGVDLRSMPIKDGVVVCPGHGLAWNVETGQLVRRYTIEID